MGKSPGHEKWPDHKVEETRVDRPLRVTVNGETVAESDDVILVEEDGHPDRYYFPRTDVRMDLFERSAKTTQCPFKGKGRYFSLKTDGGEAEDLAWSYEDPYQEHRDLKDRLAFHDDKPGIQVQPGA